MWALWCLTKKALLDYIERLIDAMKARPVDLTSLAQETSVQFASVELVEMAASCLDEITKEMEKDESKDSSAATASISLAIFFLATGGF